MSNKQLSPPIGYSIDKLLLDPSECLTYLGVDTDDAVAIVARVGEDGLVAFDAVGMLVAQDVALPSQRLVALPATKVAQVPILRHGFRILSTENQLRGVQKEKKQKKFISHDGYLAHESRRSGYVEHAGKDPVENLKLND